MGTTYKVDIELSAKGNLDAALGQALPRSIENVDRGVKNLFDRVGGIGGKLMAPLDAVASKVASIGMSFATWGGAAIIGAATYGVMSLNNELEKTQISLAAVFTANGVSGNIGEGMQMAGDVMKDMRADAAKLPGEFRDLVGIMQAVSIPGFRAGLDVDSLRAVSSQIMAAGAVANLPMDQVAREAAMLMEGRSGAHNTLGMRLMGLSGDKAEEFNKLDPGERVKRMRSELEKFAPSIDVFAKSFGAASSTMVDNGKRLLETATKPLFDRVVGAMTGINDWFTANESRALEWATGIGEKFGEAFDWGKAKILEWGPALLAQVEVVQNRLVNMWETIEPVVVRVGKLIEGFITNPEAFDKLTSLAKGYGGLKVGSMALDAGISGASMGASLLGGAGGIGGAAGGIEGIIGALGGIGAAGPVAIAALAGIAVVLFSAAGAVSALTDSGSALHQQAVDDANAMQTDVSAAFNNLTVSAHGMWTNIKPLAEAMGVTIMDSAAIGIHAIKVLTDNMNYLGDAVEFVALRIGIASRDIQNSAPGKKGSMTGNDKAGPGDLPISAENLPLAGGKSGAAHPGGGGGTTVQKVEIVVTSNQEPSRIARMVMGEIANLNRHPSVSRGVPNYSAVRP